MTLPGPSTSEFFVAIKQALDGPEPSTFYATNWLVSNVDLMNAAKRVQDVLAAHRAEESNADEEQHMKDFAACIATKKV